ncbi:MAG TPA: polysaccharide deacetylase family protein, partial [Pyrinomonadaceae bacterium]|nr:polysaccharide deacetylase family protein [Pyrinomonadaceae bacterium]
MKKSSDPTNGKAVFVDTKGHRRRWFSPLAIALGTVTTILLALFAVSVLINPFLPQVKLKPAESLPQKSDLQFHLPERPLTRQETLARKIGETARQEENKRDDARLERASDLELKMAAKRAQDIRSVHEGPPLAVGFFVNWDDSSLASLRQNIDSLDWVVPEWMRLSGDMGNPLVLDVDDNAVDFIQRTKPDMPVLPLLQNYKDEQWNTDILTRSISTETDRRRLITSLLEVIDHYKFGGLTIDIEEVPASSQTDLFTFMRELRAEFQPKGLLLAQAVPFDNPDWNYKAYASVTDYLMLMAYDQHWSTGPSGPVSGEDWYEEILKRRMAELSPAKTIVCFGNYGYNWANDNSEAETLSFQESLLAATESLDSIAEIKFDPASKNPYYTYTEEDGKDHTVWFLDAATAYNQIQAARPYGVAGFALWRLGSEDPSLWKIFGAGGHTGSPDDLATIKYGYDVDFQGTGEILQVVAQPQDGIRDIKPGNDGEIAQEIYRQTPSSYVIQRAGDKPGKIALTFDDGPDSVWTPQVLDILKQENIKATFFIVGENGQANPDIVRRIVNEGHEIGNHSFTHPNLAEVPRRVTDIELNATERLIESLTGHST